jgi:hypothetical protein
VPPHFLALYVNFDESGLSVGDYADKAGISRQVFYNWLNGKTWRPKRDHVELVWHRLRIDISPEARMRKAGVR